jgi:hypothetical protein
VSSERGRTDGARRIILTPDDLYEADRRATPEEREMLNREPFKVLGLTPQVQTLLRLLGREDELPPGSYVAKVWRNDATLGEVTVEVSS